MYKLNIPGYAHAVSMRVHEQGDQHVSVAIRENGLWEPFETHLICSLLKPESIFVDVGANIGYYSVVASKLLSKGKIFAFEPDPRNFTLLEDNLRLNSLDNVTAVNVGLSEADETAHLFLSDSNYGDHQVYDDGTQREQVSIRLLNGDNYFCHKVSKIDVIKIDTQGAEQFVVLGLEGILRRSLPNLSMIIEFWPFGLRNAGCHAHQLLDFLLSLELPMFIIDHIEHRLIPCEESDLRPWINDLDEDQKNEGFLNLYIGESPL